MRHRKIHGVQDKLNQSIEYLIKQNINQNINLNSEFNNRNNIFEMEIGIGKGKFITSKALNNPNVNYIGMELKDQIILRAVTKSKELQLNNVKFMTGNALELNTILEENSIDTLYLNFSDPWPKNRHVKRRLTSRNFLEVYKYILKNDGWIHFKTDNVDLFEFTLNELVDLDLIIKNITLDLHNNEKFIGNVTTEYEERFLKLGKKIMGVSFKFR